MLRAGVALVPAPTLVPVVILLTARAVQCFGRGPLVAVAGLPFTGGMVWLACFASVTPDHLRDLLPSQVMTGAGIGLTLGALVAAGVRARPAGALCGDRVGAGQLRRRRGGSGRTGVRRVEAVRGGCAGSDGRVLTDGFPFVRRQLGPCRRSDMTGVRRSRSQEDASA
ncbi:hypothetical protein [Streptomyces sp. NBC_01579]|uniref:hypothetical protein n=1 Tax=Streptomyces sp. NBC_01579 TaxID=2975885 RepID=UPI00386FCFEB